MCKDGKLMQICDRELAVTRLVKFMREKSIEYETNKKGPDGKSLRKSKNEFMAEELPIAEFLQFFHKKFRIFTIFTMKWQQQDWAWLKTNFPRGSWCCVQDFSENLIIEVAMENQSKYYHNISVTLFGLCGYFWIDDCKDSFISKEDKMMMKADCETKNLPHIVILTWAFVSDDGRHNQAFVQHCNGLALEYVKKHIMLATPKVTYARSDGAPTQFQNATQHFYIGMHHMQTNTQLDWSLHW